MTVNELIDKLKELQAQYPNLYLSPKNSLRDRIYKRKDKYFVVFDYELSEEEWNNENYMRMMI